MQNILAIGAHFDDVDLAVGGTLNLLSKKRKRVFKLTLTDNVTRSKNLKLNIDYRTSSNSSEASSNILGKVFLRKVSCFLATSASTIVLITFINFLEFIIVFLFNINIQL